MLERQSVHQRWTTMTSCGRILPGQGNHLSLIFGLTDLAYYTLRTTNHASFEEMTYPAKTDEVLEKIQVVFDPPHFGEKYCRFCGTCFRLFMIKYSLNM